MARSRPSIRKAIPVCISRRVLALGSLLCPQVYGLRFVSPARMLNLPFAASSTILRAYVPSVAARDSNIRSYRQASWFYITGKRRISSGGLWTRYATRSDPGYSETSEKVYRADDVLLRESDIENCRQYDECDVSSKVLGKGFGSGAPREEPGSAGQGDPSKKGMFHVHFGAGRLGLGLVVGAIVESKTPFAIVQRPKPTWIAITSKGCGSRVQLLVNGEPVVKNVTVISEDCDVEEYLKRGQAAMCVVGDRSTLLQLVHKLECGRPAKDDPFYFHLKDCAGESLSNAPGFQATSFSCSLGSAMSVAMIPLLSDLADSPPGERPVLYACENDHDAVRTVGKALESKVTTIPCMVDRICTGRQIEGHAINVEAEPTFGGSLVLLDPPADPELVPFAGDQVLLPSNEKEAKYFYKRKLSVVNGMHTVLGFMTLREKAPEARECVELDLLAYATAREELRKQMWTWVVVRSLNLLEEFGLEMLKKAHHVETEKEVFDVLLDYGKQALDRFSSVVDKTTRVLGGGVGNRLVTRLRPMVDFLEKHPMAGTGSPGERFLEYAGVEEAYAKEVTSRLAKDSVVYCTKEKREALEAKKAKEKEVLVTQEKEKTGERSSGGEEGTETRSASDLMKATQ